MWRILREGDPNDFDDKAGTNNPTQNNDVLVGIAGSDTISALNGNDAIYGRAGGDNLSGNNDNDIIFGGSGNDFDQRQLASTSSMVGPATTPLSAAERTTSS